MRTRRVPVLVVGAGPVGLSTALFLAHWGVRPLVVDKRGPDEGPPRAVTSLRTLELFRAVGLGPALERVGWRGGEPMGTVFRDTALGTTLHRGGLPPRYARRLAECGPVDPLLNVANTELGKAVAAELVRRGGQVRHGTVLTGIEEDGGDGNGTGSGGAVRARVADTAAGEEWTVVADYVVGADGANSTVRRLLGVTVPDRTAVAQVNTAFFRADLGPVLEDWGTHLCFVRNEGVYATVFSRNGRDLWSSHIMDYPGKPPGQADLGPERTVELLRTAIGDPSAAVELLAVNAWEAALGIASAFRRGRVFLAGDSAHVQSSAGGLGMNTGIQDGHNLAWKLAAVLRGEAAAPLLDTYEPERRAAARASLALSRGLHRGYQELGDDGPEALYERIAADYLRGMMFYGYDGSGDGAGAGDGAGEGGAGPDGSGGAAADVLCDAVRPGYRFPHRWVADGVSTLDLAAARWTLLTGPRGAAWERPAREAAAALGVPLAVRGIGADAHRGLEGLAADGAALVRPDGCTAWAAGPEGSRGARLEGALRAALGRGAGAGDAAGGGGR